MKLPFEFGIKLIFRLIFPGAILAAALVPAIYALLHAMNFHLRFEYVYSLAVVACGWALVVADMPIYMLFEGRRYWPAWIRELLLRREARRLKYLRDLLDKPGIDRRRFLEAGVEYGLYPTNESGEAYVAHPTRLGNIVEEFESYPTVKYGLDSVFYWFRLWVTLDKDLREEIDTAQALVDSTVYIALVFYLSGFLMFIYAGISLSSRLLGFSQASLLPYVPGPIGLIVLGAGCVGTGFLIYRLSLCAHAQFGELFKSVFDQYRSKLNFEDIVAEVDQIMGSGAELSSRPQREKNQIAWRYLRWHLIRDDRLRKNLTVEQWQERQRSEIQSGKESAAGEFF